MRIWPWLLGGALGLLGWKASRSPSSPAPGGGGSTGGLPAPPRRIPGWYGNKWKNNRPASLPADAYGAGDTGGARAYGLALAKRLGGEQLWLKTIDRLGSKESGWTAGLPAHVFGGNQRSWGLWQYLTSAVQAEPFFGEWQNVAPWYHPIEVEIGAPMARYREQWNQAASRSRDPLAPVAGVFLWQAAPAWRRRYWEALEAGADYMTALRAACTPKPAYADTIAGHVQKVINGPTVT